MCMPSSPCVLPTAAVHDVALRPARRQPAAAPATTAAAIAATSSASHA